MTNSTTMRARRKLPYWRLLRKEITQALPMVAIVTALIAAWHGYLFTRLPQWPMELIFAMAVTPTGFIPLWLLWRSIATLRQEWAGNHMYLLLALPVPGWYLASTKALVVLTEVLWYGVIVAGGTYVLALRGQWLSGIAVDVIDISINGQLIVGLLAFFVVLPLAAIIVTQFAYIVGRLAQRFSGLVSAVAFGLSMWVIVRTGTLLAPVLRWIPDVPIGGVTHVDGVVVQYAVYVSAAPVFGALIAVVVLFWLGASFLERDVEL